MARVSSVLRDYVVYIGRAAAFITAAVQVLAHPHDWPDGQGVRHGDDSGRSAHWPLSARRGRLGSTAGMTWPGSQPAAS